jgi:transcriptional regulator NrdR family protein
MTCPECEDDEIKNLGGKQKHESFDTRRYECQGCGHRFMTVEKHHRPIRPRAAPKPDVD